MKNQNQNRNDGQSASTQRLVLPLIKSLDDAEELCRLEQDDFYMVVFYIHLWLADTGENVKAEYAEKKDPRTRSLQSGQAWRSLVSMFGKLLREGGPQLPGATAIPDEQLTLADLDEHRARAFFQHLLRYASFDHPVSCDFTQALNNVAIAMNLKLEPMLQPPFKMHPGFGDPRLALAYFCDWLDAAIHLHNHQWWHVAPALFHPDREHRRLATIGFLARHCKSMTEKAQAVWHQLIDANPENFTDDAKMAKVADGMRHHKPRLWNYEEVDRAVIRLWPLVKRYNWTYADLLNVIRPALKRPNAYPCDRVQNFSTYCNNVLGLRKNVCLPSEASCVGGRKTGKGRTSKEEPIGADVAWELLGLE